MAGTRSTTLPGALLLAAGLLLARPSPAQLVCEVAPSMPEASLLNTPAPPPGKIRLSADQADLTRAGQLTLRGDVQIRMDDRALLAEQASLNQQTWQLSVEGPVRFVEPGLSMRSDSAQLDTLANQVRFNGASFTLPSRPARGSADSIVLRADQTAQLDRVFYTTCPEGNEDWRLRAKQIELHAAQGFGAARNVRIEFFNVPILYAPYISFPINDQRKTGFLVPQVGNSQRSGTDFSVPYYLNLAPNYDLTLTPRFMSLRGLQLTSEFRYLTPSSLGQLSLEYLPHDTRTGKRRGLLDFSDESIFNRHWRVVSRIRNVSDDEYFEDLGNSLSTTSQTHLDRRIDIQIPKEHWQVLGRVQAFQTIATTIPAAEEPYRRLPQLAARGYWPDQFLGSILRLDAETDNFEHDVDVSGWRVNLVPDLSLPLRGHGLFLTPEVAAHYTGYRLRDTAPDMPSDPSRFLPVYSVDTGATFERLSSNRRWLQTIEPRVLYTHIPYRNQDGLPVFDTILPDLNLVQLFRPNRFQGTDRIADTDQLSIGLGTRWIDADTGEERINAAIGEVRYLSDQRISLPGVPPRQAGSADYITEMAVHLSDRWNVNLAHQWDSDTNATTRSEVRFQYAPDSRRVLNLSYRYRRQTLEQSDISFSWPVSNRWNLVGRYNYSFRDNAGLERFLGAEYQSCCWGVRLVARRYISRRTGETDNSLSLQIELKGLTSVGDPADRLLERGILGYARDRDEAAGRGP